MLHVASKVEISCSFFLALALTLSLYICVFAFLCPALPLCCLFCFKNFLIYAVTEAGVAAPVAASVAAFSTASTAASSTAFSAVSAAAPFYCHLCCKLLMPCNKIVGVLQPAKIWHNYNLFLICCCCPCCCLCCCTNLACQLHVGAAREIALRCCCCCCCWCSFLALVVAWAPTQAHSVNLACHCKLQVPVASCNRGCSVRRGERERS